MFTSDFTRPESVERVRLELVARKFMVTILGLIATGIGVAMMLTGAPDFIEGWFSPWSRYFVGSFAFVAGLLVAIGGSFGDDNRIGWTMQVSGLSILTLWNIGYGCAYLIMSLERGVQLAMPGEALSPSMTGTDYVPLVYFGLTTMAVVPLRVMLKVGWPSRREML